jgi:hypothetical protein
MHMTKTVLDTAVPDHAHDPDSVYNLIDVSVLLDSLRGFLGLARLFTSVLQARGRGFINTLNGQDPLMLGKFKRRQCIHSIDHLSIKEPAIPEQTSSIHSARLEQNYCIHRST